MPGALAPYPRLQFFDDNGLPLAAGKLFTYAAGTDTPRAIYTDSTLGTAHPNPALLDGAGRITIYLIPGQSYKFLLTDALDALVWEQDQVSVSGGGSASGGDGASLDVSGMAGVELPASTPVYFESDGKWYVARGDTPARSTTARVVGMTVAAIPLGMRGTIRLGGLVAAVGGVIAGAAYYIAPTGGLTTSGTYAGEDARFMGYGDADGLSLLVLSAMTVVSGPPAPPDPPPTAPFSAQILLVAGGGGGGYPGTLFQENASGGGAGGLHDVTVSLTPGITLTGVVGAGGVGGASNTSGADSSITGPSVGLLAHGGGRGGHFNAEGVIGGSGGGSKSVVAGGYPGEGFAGGIGGFGQDCGGGGGKGGAATFGAGGTGYISLITGSSVTYACGGGNGFELGGSGGGGNGADSPAGPSSTAGTSPGSGGGGGAVPASLARLAGGAGANGICVVRYLGAARATGGTISSAGGYTMHTFTTVGAFSLVFS